MIADRDPRIDQLYGVPRALAEALGYEAGIKLMTAFGGMQIQVPMVARPKQRLWQLLGRDAAEAMSRLYAGHQIEIPNGGPLRAAARNRAIAEYEGSHNEAARHFGVTRRWVKMVRRAKRTSDGPLFDAVSKRD
jgi:hypothetical protein